MPFEIMPQLFILKSFIFFFSVCYPINCVNLEYILSHNHLRWVRKFNPHTSNASTFYKCVLRDVIVYNVQPKCLGLCWYCCQWWWHDDPRDLHLYFHAHFTALVILDFVFDFFCNCSCFMCEHVTLTSKFWVQKWH